MFGGEILVSKLQGAAQACMRSIRSHRSKDSLNTTFASTSGSNPSPNSILIPTETADATLKVSDRSSDDLPTTNQSPSRTESQTDIASMNVLNRTALFSVKDLVVVVTGGGTGIGLMIAKALENNGAIVYIVGRREEVLRKAASDNNQFGNIIPLPGDVTDEKSRNQVVDAVKKRSGYINVLINNAGVSLDIFKRYSPGDDIKTFQQKLMSSSSPEEFTRTFDTNVSAVYFTTVAFLELLHLGNERRIPGSPTSQVITMSSGAGFRRDDKVYSLSYGLSKAAVTQLGKQFANIFAPFKIRSNIVAPGIYPSEMTDPIIDMDHIGPEAVPLERPGNIDDMGGLILYLVSRAGSYANGGVFLSDGGRLGLFPSSY